MTLVAILQPTEDVSVDQDELARIYIQMDGAADEMVAQSIEELALRLPHAELLYQRQQHDELKKCVTGIATIAARIGMSVLARVGTDVAQCCDTGDPAALPATLSRMIRVGEGALHEIWELQELPI
ncbi:hypothetical protein [Shimia sp.]|uniref:hypothetical protein n=1 Tax=Shimia sp. TaxID=1954381 RepID=UPI00329A1CC5